MKLNLVLLLLCLVFPYVSWATNISFDELPHTDYDIVPDGYEALSWSNFYYGATQDAPDSGYRQAVVSALNVAFNAEGDPATFSATTPFNFVSAYLTAAWNDLLQVKIEGSLNGITKYNRVVTVNTDAPTEFIFDFTGIDQVYFESYGGSPNPNYQDGYGTNFVMDNIDVTSASVPLPSTLLMFLSGLGVILMMAKPRKLQSL